METFKAVSLFVFRFSVVVIAIGVVCLCCLLYAAYDSNEKQKADELELSTTENNELIRYKCAICKNIKVSKKKDTHKITDTTTEIKSNAGSNDPIEDWFKESNESNGLVCSQCYSKF